MCVKSVYPGPSKRVGSSHGTPYDRKWKRFKDKSKFVDWYYQLVAVAVVAGNRASQGGYIMYT